MKYLRDATYVVGGYVVRGGRVLLLWHGGLSRWVPTGGRIELASGEYPHEALIREVREETGLAVRVASGAGLEVNALAPWALSARDRQRDRCQHGALDERADHQTGRRLREALRFAREAGRASARAPASYGKHEPGGGECAGGEDFPARQKSLVGIHHDLLSSGRGVPTHLRSAAIPISSRRPRSPPRCGWSPSTP